MCFVVRRKLTMTAHQEQRVSKYNPYIFKIIHNMKEVMSKQDSLDEVTAWLDYKKMDPEVREMQGGNIKLMAGALQYGALTLNHDTWEFTQPLKFPLTDKNDVNKVILDKLVFKARMNLLDAKKASQGVKSNDIDGKVVSYIAALTDTAEGYINKLDTEDAKIAGAIAVFFLT